MSKGLLTLDLHKFWRHLVFKWHTQVLAKAITAKRLFVLHFQGNFKERSQLNYKFWTFSQMEPFSQIVLLSRKMTPERRESSQNEREERTALGCSALNHFYAKKQLQINHCLAVHKPGVHAGARDCA